MNDFITSLIRTYVPIGVGAVIAWLTSKGLQIDATTIPGLVAFLTAFFSGLYYLIARLLEKKFAKAGLLLGSTKKPEYTAPR